MDMVDDFLREIKKVLVQSFPNINKQTTVTSEELDNLRYNMKFVSGNSWDVNNNQMYNVASKEADNAVEPRWYNDERYFRVSNGLNELTNVNSVMANLFNKIPVGDGTLNGSSFKKLVNDVAWPVGSVYTNTIYSNNPNEYLAIGTWIAWAQGRVIVGVGNTPDNRGEVRQFNNRDQGGEYQHALSVSEMPSHDHATKSTRANPSLEGGQTSRRLFADDFGYENGLVGSAGGNQAHNNMMPYIAAFIWVRTA